MAEVTSEDVIVGASLTFATAIVKDCVATALLVSVAVRTTSWLPTSSLPGVPLSTPVVVSKLNHEGKVVAAKVTVSPLSTSFVVNV